MSHLWRARCAVLLTFAGLILLHSPACYAQARQATSVVSGTVSDPTGAEIPHAFISLTGNGLNQQIETDGTGHFSFLLPAGEYTLTIIAPGFGAFTKPIKVGTNGAPIRISASLPIAVRQEAIAVPSDDSSSTSASDNASALIFNSADLKVFSDDDATFQKELQALAGGMGGQQPQIFVDGFSGGRIPPKTAIASVRLNRNQYSAAYDTFGRNRIDILTKPGGESLHGQLDVSGTDNVLNAQNPYLTFEPPYYLLNLDGNLSGSFNRKTAFFLSGVFNDQQNNAALNALAAQNQLSPYQAAVPDPQLASTFSVRLDRQVTRANNFTARYEFNQLNLTNGGLTPLLTIANQAFNSGTTNQTLQLVDTQVFGPQIVYDSRFQYIRTRLQQNAISAAPTLVVQGAFNDGGNPNQSQRDNQDRFEFQQAVSIERGVHYLRFGARYRLLRDANLSTANYNGQFTFPSLAAYVANQPSQYSITQGSSSASVLTGDLGVYAEDEWRVTRSITLDLGLRLESQSAIPDHLDPAPRVAAGWALHRKNQKSVFLTLRAGGGIFYDRFAAANILTSIRQNGVSQQTYFINNPTYPIPPSLAQLTATPPTTYQISPNLRSEYYWTGSTSAERLFKYGRIAVTYNAIRGVHQFDSQNINAPLPGTYNPNVPGSGARPFGGSQNIYQFASNGIEKQQGIAGTLRLNGGKHGYAFFSYNHTHQDENVVNASTFVSNSYNPSQDYGRAPQHIQELFFGGSLQLPFGIDLNPYVTIQGGTPFNIVTGTDLNGDSIYNDRPAFATAPTAASQIYKTRLGTFDANPQPGEKIIPINYGNSPNFSFLQLGADRTFKVGPRAAAKATAGSKPAPRGDPPYAVSFSVQATNLLNAHNPGQPVGVLTSPLFGQSISLNNPFNPNTTANRVILLRTSFSF